MVLAGLEANRFAQRQGPLALTNERSFEGLALELGSPLNMAALEGDRHKFFRRTAARGYSREAMRSALPGVGAILRRFVADLSPGDSFDAFSALQRLVSLQLGVAAAHADATSRIDDLQRFMRYLLNVLLTGAWPRILLRAPAYRRAKARSHEFVAGVVEFHRRNPPEGSGDGGNGTGRGRAPNLIDGFLAAHRSDPAAMPVEAVRSAAFGPFLAGQDTVAATTAFLLHEILSRPKVRERVEADVEGLFREGLPDGRRFDEARTLRDATIETMRLHPVAPMMPQHAATDFEFAGRRVRAGERVFMAQTVTHFLPEHYERPFEFELDRPSPGPLAFAPYGVGPHTCIGAAMGELQVMANVAFLLRFGEFAVAPEGYRLKTRTIPPAPKGFRMRLVRRREIPYELADACVPPADLWRPEP